MTEFIFKERLLMTAAGEFLVRVVSYIFLFFSPFLFYAFFFRVGFFEDDVFSTRPVPD